MVLAFANERLRSLCENEAVARELLGDEVASQLIRRLEDLQTARFAADVVVGRPRETRLASGEAAMALLLAGDSWLVFRSNHQRRGREVDQGRDWTHVSRVLILRVGDLDG